MSRIVPTALAALLPAAVVVAVTAHAIPPNRDPARAHPAGGATAGQDRDRRAASADGTASLASPVAPLDAPPPAGSAQPQLSTAPDGTVLLSWLEPATDGSTRFRFARHDGRRWSEPRTIAEGRDFFVNWADVPSVIQLASGRLAAHWLQKSGPGAYAYDVRLRTSDDGGSRWSYAITPHRDGTQTEHGFVTLFEAADGGLGLVWLDGRAMKEGGHGDHGAGAGAGAMTLRATTLSERLVLGPDVPVDARVCECCPTAAVRTGDGVLVAYRDRGDTEIRDIFVSRHADGRWRPGVAVHADGWVMPACPVNGPTLSAGPGGVALAWFTAEGDEPRTMLAFSSDAGTTWGPPLRVDDGVSLGRLDSEMLPDGSVLVSWIEFAQGRSEVRARRVAPDGTRDRSFVVTGIGAGRASGYPRMARSGRRVYFAWTDTAAKRVRVGVLELK
jgi:hypothetical protein